MRCIGRTYQCMCCTLYKIQTQNETEEVYERELYKTKYIITTTYGITLRMDMQDETSLFPIIELNF